MQTSIDLTAFSSLNAQPTVLVAEDSEPVRKYVTSALERRGFRVLVADSGEAGLQVSEDHLGQITLLLSDFQMGRMTGIDLATELTRFRPDTRVLVMSGCAPEALLLKDGWGFIQKPFSPTQLLSAVSDVLADRQGFHSAQQK